MQSAISHTSGQSQIPEQQALPVQRANAKSATVLFWIFTVLFCLEMSFTAYYELTSQGAVAFARLGFSNSNFRIELSLAKWIGVITLLLPMVPIRLKEWAYAGFAINLISAVIAHAGIADRPLAFVPSTLTGALWIGSYLCWRRLEAAK